MLVPQTPSDTLMTVRDGAQEAMKLSSSLIDTLTRVHAFQQKQAGETAGVKPSQQQGPAPTHTPT